MLRFFIFLCLTTALTIFFHQADPLPDTLRIYSVMNFVREYGFQTSLPYMAAIMSASIIWFDKIVDAYDTFAGNVGGKRLGYTIYGLVVPSVASLIFGYILGSFFYAGVHSVVLVFNFAMGIFFFVTAFFFGIFWSYLFSNFLLLILPTSPR